MKIALTLFIVVAEVVLASSQQSSPTSDNFTRKQRQVFDLLFFITEANPDNEFYRTGNEYNIEDNIGNYTNKNAVEAFLHIYRKGCLPKSQRFSVFDNNIRKEAMALYHLFYYAKDFDTFFKTAAWAAVHLNEGLFTYAFTNAITHRADTQGILLPPIYEMYPNEFYLIQL